MRRIIALPCPHIRPLSEACHGIKFLPTMLLFPSSSECVQVRDKALSSLNGTCALIAVYHQARSLLMLLVCHPPFSFLHMVCMYWC